MLMVTRTSRLSEVFMSEPLHPLHDTRRQRKHKQRLTGQPRWRHPFQPQTRLFVWVEFLAPGAGEAGTSAILEGEHDNSALHPAPARPREENA